MLYTKCKERGDRMSKIRSFTILSL
ncbi:DUF1648 domain-containing protein, partial [Staphylococcus aureus]